MNLRRPPLGGAVELLDRATAYTCAQLSSVGEDMLGRRTPCQAWTLGDLLAHMEDALDAFTEAAGGAVSVQCTGRNAGPLPTIQAKASGLIDVWSRPAPGDVVVEAPSGRLDLHSPLLVTTAALEIAVHGWDVGRATGRDAPVPAGLAKELLAVAAWLVGPGDRGVRFAAARPAPAEAPYDQRLLAFLGRT
jgi:uncharacterized protein (TIGR03086 family)